MTKVDVFVTIYPGDYLASTGHLTTEMHGAYFLLLLHHWREESLPDDDRQLATIAKLSPYNWKKISPLIRNFFQSADGRLTQKRMVAEIEKAKNIKENRSKSGKAGAEARWGNGDGKRNADAMPENSTSPSPSPSGKERDAKASPKKIGARLPEGWAPSEADRQYAADLVLNVDRTAADFRGYWLAKAGKDAVKLDWSLTWQGWCRREADRRGTNQPGTGSGFKPGSL